MRGAKGDRDRVEEGAKAHGREGSRRIEAADGGRRTDLPVEGMVEGSEEGGGSPAMVAEKGR